MRRDKPAPMILFHTLAALASAALVASLVTPSRIPLPLVIWHGLGDSYDSDGIQSVGKLAQEVHPGTFVHSIFLDPDSDSDRSATFFGLVDTQLSEVCSQLAAVPELASGFDAVGFSQGGQFLRGYIERCNSPPIRTLITFGSQHNGISDFLGECKPADLVCRSASSLLRSHKWAPWVQKKVVPAQYFRDPEDLDSYLDHSAFLADINNERPLARNETYKANLSSLEKFVMIMFQNDTTVIPKESAWFAEFNKTTGERTPLEERDIYKNDWIGLKSLGERGKLEFLTTPGKHMELDDDVLRDLFKKYLGGKAEGAREGVRVGNSEL